MSNALIFEELDFQKTEFGDISLRKRSEPRLDNTLIYEVKLGEEFLMSSLFVEAEEQLSSICLETLNQLGVSSNLNVVVGGLGLGYTALKALEFKAVERLRVIEIMQPVIEWHKQGLLPISTALSDDARCELVHANFFEVATDDKLGFIDDQPVDAVLLDIDHSPSHWLNDLNKEFYSKQSLDAMVAKIVPGGVFGLWSDDLPDQDFVSHLESVFEIVEAHVVEFPNPYTGGVSTNSVYLGLTST